MSGPCFCVGGPDCCLERRRRHREMLERLGEEALRRAFEAKRPVVKKLREGIRERIRRAARRP